MFSGYIYIEILCIHAHTHTHHILPCNGVFSTHCMCMCAAIDGDGMVVALTFENGRVHLRNRFVATQEHMEEQRQRKFLYRGQMGTHPNSPLKDTALLLKSWLGLSWPNIHYRNPSNTNVFYWGGKVCSFFERHKILDPCLMT